MFHVQLGWMELLFHIDQRSFVSYAQPVNFWKAHSCNVHRNSTICSPLYMNGKGHNWRIRDTFYKTLKLWLEDAQNVRIMGGIAGIKSERRLTWPLGNGHVLSRVRRACQSVIVRNEKCTRKSRIKSVHCTHSAIYWLHDRAIVQNFSRMNQSWLYRKFRPSVTVWAMVWNTDIQH